MEGNDSEVSKILAAALAERSRELAKLKVEASNESAQAEEARLQALAATAPISPEEYERWLPPPVAIKMLEPILVESFAKREIYNRLCGGEILCVARTANWYHQRTVETKDYGRLGAFIWQINQPKDHDLFWRTGTHKLLRPLHPSATSKHPVECFGIRFEPQGINAVLRDSGIALTSASSDVRATSKKPLSEADAEKFARAIIAGWPQASQDWAHEKLGHFFPDHTMGRENFRRIFRAIQGHKPRGKPPKKV